MKHLKEFLNETRLRDFKGEVMVSSVEPTTVYVYSCNTFCDYLIMFSPDVIFKDYDGSDKKLIVGEFTNMHHSNPGSGMYGEIKEYLDNAFFDKVTYHLVRCFAHNRLFHDNLMMFIYDANIDKKYPKELCKKLADAYPQVSFVPLYTFRDLKKYLGECGIQI